MADVVRAEERCEPEVEHPHGRRPGARGGARDHQQVGGLEVAVHNARGMQGLEAVRNLGADEAERRPVAARERGVCGAAGHVLHRVERRPDLVEPQLQGRDHRRVPDAGERVELAAQVRQVEGSARLEPLERALGAGGEIERQEHLAHAAAAEGLEQTIAPGETRVHRSGPVAAWCRRASSRSTPSRASGSGTPPWRSSTSWNSRSENAGPSKLRASSRSSRMRHLPSV